jgi:membrane protease YdiL (CAAX protease family)
MKRAHWGMWIAGTIAILGTWIFFGALITVFAKATLPTDPAWAKLLVDLSGFIPFFIATPLVWRYLLDRPVADLVNVTGRISVRRLGIGFATWLALSGAGTLVDAGLNPNNYRYTFSLAQFLPFALITVLLLPVQTWAEELFFRGWILRWSSGLPRFSQVFISGIVFAWPHLGNPEAASDAWLALLAYFLLGAGWAYVSVRAGGIELAMGAHLANNAFSLLVVGYDDAALPTSAIFTTTNLNLVSTVVSLAVMVPLFAYFTRKQHLATTH